MLARTIARATVAAPRVASRLHMGSAAPVLLRAIRPLSDGIHDDFKPQTKRAYANEAPDVHAQIQKDIDSHKVVVFMKGFPESPMCGFSNAVVQVLKAEGVEFKGFNVLQDPDLREGIKSFSNWPTIPQVRAKPPQQAAHHRQPLWCTSSPLAVTTMLSSYPPCVQVYVGGEFIGGCDTTVEMYKSGELKDLLVEKGAK